MYKRQVLASLDTRQQALILGHAVPMPVVVRTRPYDETFYRAMGGQAVTMSAQQIYDESDELFP